MNFPQWIEDAKAVAAAVRDLPGEEANTTIEFAPPLSEAEADAIATRWPRGLLPEALRRFWTEGSAQVICHYHWEPFPDDLPRLQEVISHRHSLYGGPEFPPAEYIFPNNGLDPDEEDVGAKGAELWRRCAVFIFLKNGDALALDPEENPDDPAVVYLFHDEHRSGRISSSFT